MSVLAIEAEVSIKSGVSAECTIGREVVVEVHDDVNLESLTVTANGRYAPAKGVDGYSDVIVAVPERAPDIEELTVTANGTYTADGDGYNPVTVSVPERIPVTESLSVTENGTYYPTGDIDGYDRVVVNVPPTIPDIEPLTVTQDGTYTASGDGYNPVTVNTGVGALRQEIASAETASGCSPLTECITALTTYANEVTGQEDETLSDAVTRLVAGYGGGGIENGVEIKAVDSSGRATSIVVYGSTINSFLLGSKSNSDYAYSWIESIQFADEVESIGANAFSYFGAKRTNSEGMEMIFSSGLTTVDSSAFSCSGFTKLYFPETFVGRLSDTVFYNASKLKEVVLPGITSLDTRGGDGNGQFYGCTALENVQVGSIGHGVTDVETWNFRGCKQTTLTITLYTTGNLVDEHLTKLRDATYGATGATIIFKASEATTYNGTSYASGDTILTSTPNS